MERDSQMRLRSVWPIGAPHTVEQRTFAYPDHKPHTEDVLVPTKGSKRELRQDDLADLLNDLVDLGQRPPSLFAKYALQFADKYGPMGYNRMVREENRCQDRGEPLGWLAAHARTIHACSVLINLASYARKDKDARKKLKHYLENFPTGPYGEGGVVRPLLYTYVSDHVDAADNVVRSLLEPNLGNVNREVYAGALVHNIFSCDTPLQIAYWQLADQVGKDTIQRCAECGRVFLYDRPVKFCLPAPRKTISRCKARFNIREMRKRKKTQGRRTKR